MSGVSSVVIKIGAETASAVGAIRNVDKALGDTQTTGQKMAGAVRSAAIPAAAALTVLTAAGVASAKAAADDAQSRQLLDSQLQRTLGSTKEATAANEEWINSLSDATAVSRDELRPALAGAVRATGDLTKSHQMLQLALDTSAATGKPLGSVMTALEKAYAGNTGSLKRLMPGLSDAVLKTKDYAFIQAVLNKQVEGAAKGQADTAAGQYKKMELAMHELQVEIGQYLLPIMSAFLPVVTSVLGVFAGHSAVIVAVATAVGGFAAAILVANAALSAYETIQSVSVAVQAVWNSELLASAAQTIAYTASLVGMQIATIATTAATKAWAIAQWLLNAALDANPIGLAVIAVAALTAGIILAYRHSATFRAMVQSAFQLAKQNVVLLLGPMGLLIRAFMLLYQNSGTVRAGVQAALRAINTAVQDTVKMFQRLASAGGPARQALTSALQAVADAIQAVISAVQNLIGQIGRIHFPSKPSWVPFSVPMAAGGASSRAAGAGGMVVNVNISGAIDPESTALAIRRTLERYDRRRGRRPLGGAVGGLGGD